MHNTHMHTIARAHTHTHMRTPQQKAHIHRNVHKHTYTQTLLKHTHNAHKLTHTHKHQNKKHTYTFKHTHKHIQHTHRRACSLPSKSTSIFKGYQNFRIYFHSTVKKMVFCFICYWRENNKVHKLGSQCLVPHSGTLLLQPSASGHSWSILGRAIAR